MRSRLGLTGLATALPAVLLAGLAGDAAAVRAPDGLDERPLEPAEGRARQAVPTSWRTPRAARKAWAKLGQQHPGAWQAVWDLDRAVPLRVWGEGVAFPGASTDAAKAEGAARQLLAEQLELLAPGSTVADWTLVSNVTHGRGGALRTVGFVQQHRGLPVLGGQLSFLFKHDRLIVMSSAAAAHVAVTLPARRAPDDALTAAAVAWIARLYGATPTVLGPVGDLAILPVVRARADGQAVIDHRVVRTVVVDLAAPGAPRARWDVHVDAATGQPVARAQTLRFGAGTVRYDAPVRYPAGGRQAYAAPRAGITVDAAAAVTDATGGFAFAGAGPAAVTVGVSGPLVRVTSESGSPATGVLDVPDGASATWSAAAEPTVDAQLSAFIHAGLAKAYARAELTPQIAWLEQPLDVVVNESGSCNAYSTGDDIHFFAASSQCENTARLADVVYHELGHSLHAHAIVPGAGAFDSHMSEGVSDYLAATITDDPGMGRGFFIGDGQALRHLDPTVGGEARYPEDMSDDPHASGLIIAGALWDVRKALIAAYGEPAGRQLADDFYVATITRASEIPTAYVEILAADDDDGNLANGTPHKCLIDAAFIPHGLLDLELTLGIGAPVLDGPTVRVATAPAPGACPAAALRELAIDWRIQGETLFRHEAMTLDGATYRGAIPPQPDGTVVEYKVTVTTVDGGSVVFPANVADPLYQLYVGPLEPVYCSDFESDPFAAGWTRSAPRAWAWGAPAGEAGSGDPDAAASGTNVVGMDLGGASDGVYDPDETSELVSPVIDVTGRTGVRLQYRRWLTVEDGFYDRATVVADGQELWANLASARDPATTHHVDREWRVHDVDLAAQAADGAVQVTFRLAADAGYEFGGWTVDDVCIMARPLGVDEPPVDDGGGCCSTGGGGGGAPVGPLGLGLLTALAIVGRRRRRA